jgi:hypothetical protein
MTTGRIGGRLARLERVLADRQVQEVPPCATCRAWGALHARQATLLRLPKSKAAETRGARKLRLGPA